MSESNNTWSFSQTFTAEFQASRIDLESRIAAATATLPTAADVQDLSTRLAKLSRSLTDASASLPTYDQKLYANQVQSLEKDIEKFRSSATPKSRFAFKRRAAAEITAPPPIRSTSPLPSTLIAVGDEGRSTPPVPPPSESESATRGLELSEHSKQYLTFVDLPSEVSPDTPPDLAISNLSRCIVNLLPSPGSNLTFSALHIRNLSDCILLLPFTQGSALIHDVKNCVLVLGCHQFRMHNSTSIDAYLRISSNPIIETCHKIRFAMYPSRLAPQLLKEPPLPPFTVQDFSHIRATPSPNFSHISSKLQFELKPWPTDRIADPEELAKTLVTLLPETAAL